ncbi:MAG: hypothetical protein Q7S86_00495, partial [bacterium]|nr:hypothetical protein [bacterium]
TIGKRTELLSGIGTFADYFSRVAGAFQIPIYDLEGGLLWPKEMHHQEVVQMIGNKNQPSK